MSNDKDGYLNFDEYIRQGEPAQQEKAGYWQAAIGLQAVDGLKVSEYLQNTARRHIEGDISIDEACELVNQYYITKTLNDTLDEDTEEADRVSSNIVKVLSSPTFNFTTGGYQSVHRRVFEGAMKHAGEFRTYDITKKEWVLEGDTVLYLNWEDLRRAIDYDLEQERAYTYKDKGSDEMISHLTRFVAGLWQIHAFAEGNTRSTAVFTIQYLRSLGFDVDNDQFAKHSWYFRNALVRANYRNVAKGIEYEPLFLIRFFRNLLLGEKNILKNRYMMINPPEEWKKPEGEMPNQRITNEQVEDKLRTSTAQAPHKYRISSSVTNSSPDSKFCTSNEGIIELVRIIGNDELSISQMMDIKKLKHRPNFVDTHLEPALQEKFVRRKYPDRPNHPRQKYLLTVKGAALYRELMNE